MTTPAFGSAEHAAMMTEGRHQGTRDAVAWLTFLHLPEALRPFSRPFYVAALALLPEVPDAPELTTALNGLISSKDSAVRAGIKGQTGKAGPVSRPQEVVDPLAFGQAQVPARPDQRIPGLPNHPDFRGPITDGPLR